MQQVLGLLPLLDGRLERLLRVLVDHLGAPHVEACLAVGRQLGALVLHRLPEQLLPLGLLVLDRLVVGRHRVLSISLHRLRLLRLLGRRRCIRLRHQLRHLPLRLDLRSLGICRLHEVVGALGLGLRLLEQLLDLVVGGLGGAHALIVVGGRHLGVGGVGLGLLDLVVLLAHLLLEHLHPLLHLLLLVRRCLCCCLRRRLQRLLHLRHRSYLDGLGVACGDGGLGTCFHARDLVLRPLLQACCLLPCRCVRLVLDLLGGEVFRGVHVLLVVVLALLPLVRLLPHALNILFGMLRLDLVVRLLRQRLRQLLADLLFLGLVLRELSLRRLALSPQPLVRLLVLVLQILDLGGVAALERLELLRHNLRGVRQTRDLVFDGSVPRLELVLAQVHPMESHLLPLDLTVERSQGARVCVPGIRSSIERAVSTRQSGRLLAVEHLRVVVVVDEARHVSMRVARCVEAIPVRFIPPESRAQGLESPSRAANADCQCNAADSGDSSQRGEERPLPVHLTSNW
mmetsp:Transcript_56380/g.115329  ORF Transcript_56380/g.115329 Transcript_56380/m.115329 type:complete len:513 (-) Transcript_56380:72-1610(-)